MEVQTLIGASAGSYRVTGQLGGKHPADGMTAEVAMGDGAYMSIINPQSFNNGGIEWRMRYGDPDGIRHTVASLLSSYNYLLSGEISMAEATRRLRLMRQARKGLSRSQPKT